MILPLEPLRYMVAKVPQKKFAKVLGVQEGSILLLLVVMLKSVCRNARRCCFPVEPYEEESNTKLENALLRNPDKNVVLRPPWC